MSCSRLSPLICTCFSNSLLVWEVISDLKMIYMFFLSATPKVPVSKQCLPIALFWFKCGMFKFSNSSPFECMFAYSHQSTLFDFSALLIFLFCTSHNILCEYTIPNYEPDMVLSGHLYYVMDQASSLPLNGRRLNTGGLVGELHIISPGAWNALCTRSIYASAGMRSDLGSLRLDFLANTFDSPPPSLIGLA